MVASSAPAVFGCDLFSLSVFSARKGDNTHEFSAVLDRRRWVGQTECECALCVKFEMSFGHTDARTAVQNIPARIHTHTTLITRYFRIG